MRRPADARGFSLIEVLVALGILGVLLLPIMDMLITSNRAAASARRMLDTTLYAQSLLETMAELTPDDLPVQDGELLATGAVPLRGRGKGSRLTDVSPDLLRDPPFRGKRTIDIKWVGKNVQITVTVEWEGVPGEPKTRQTIVLRELTVARDLQ